MEDLSSIMEICKISFKERYSEEFMLSCFDLNPDHFIVADNGHVAGFVLGVRHSSSVGRVLILAVDPKSWGMGIGKALMMASIESYRAQRVSEVRLEVKVSNYRALALYESIGFRKVGRTKNYYVDGEDAFLLSKSLPVSILD